MGLDIYVVTAHQATAPTGILFDETPFNLAYPIEYFDQYPDHTAGASEWAEIRHLLAKFSFSDSKPEYLSHLCFQNNLDADAIKEMEALEDGSMVIVAKEKLSSACRSIEVSADDVKAYELEPPKHYFGCEVRTHLAWEGTDRDVKDEIADWFSRFLDVPPVNCGYHILSRDLAAKFNKSKLAAKGGYKIPMEIFDIPDAEVCFHMWY